MTVTSSPASTDALIGLFPIGTALGDAGMLLLGGCDAGELAAAFGTPASSIRAGDYVLIEFFEDGKLELYDIVKDLGQKNDLARAMPERVREMHGRLQAWRREVAARIPLENPDWKKKK